MLSPSFCYRTFFFPRVTCLNMYMCFFTYHYKLHRETAFFIIFFFYKGTNSAIYECSPFDEIKKELSSWGHKWTTSKYNPIQTQICWIGVLKYFFFLLIQQILHFYFITLSHVPFGALQYLMYIENTLHFVWFGHAFFPFLSLWLCNANFIYLSVSVKLFHCTYSFLLQLPNALFSWPFPLPSLKNFPEASDRKWTYLNVPETDGDTVSSPESSA